MQEEGRNIGEPLALPSARKQERAEEGGLSGEEGVGEEQVTDGIAAKERMRMSVFIVEPKPFALMAMIDESIEQVHTHTHTPV